MSLYTETITAAPSVFTPPAGCKTEWTYEASYYNGISGGLLIQNALAEHPDSTCYPSGFGGYGRAPEIQVFSPFVCPHGYTTPGVFTNAGTTTAICCSSGFSYYSIVSSIDHFDSSTVLYMGCLSSFSGTTSVIARANNTDLNSTDVSGSFTMWAQPITALLAQSDNSLFAALTSTSTPTSSSTTSETGSATSAAIANPSQSSTPPPSGMSTAAKAGIGAGIGVVVLLLIALLAFFCIRTRKSKKQAALPMTYQETKPPMGLSPNQQWYNEMDGRNVVPELPPKHPYQVQQYQLPRYSELDGARPGYPVVSELQGHQPLRSELQ